MKLLLAQSKAVSSYLDGRRGRRGSRGRGREASSRSGVVEGGRRRGEEEAGSDSNGGFNVGEHDEDRAVEIWGVD